MSVIHLEGNPILSSAKSVSTDFVFVLLENFRIWCKTGVIGYQCKVEINFVREAFFIGVSREYKIIGPFKRTSKMYYDESDLGFVRLQRNINTYDGYSSGPAYVAPALCPYRFKADLVAPRQNQNALPAVKLSSLGSSIPNGDRVWTGLHAVTVDDAMFNFLYQHMVVRL